MARITTVILDADDTLWHNEKYFQIAETRFLAALAPYANGSSVRQELAKCIVRNIDAYGYGAKSFTLSMIETAIRSGGDALSSIVIGEILEIGRELLKHPVELFSGVPEALERLSRQANLILLTKGDLLHQELKIAASGVAEWFQAIEIVSDKSASVLMRMIAKHSLRANTLIVVGDSLRSDILPALEIGAWAAHIPHPLAWSHERAILPALAERFRELTNLSEVQTWIDEINEN